MNSAIAIYLTVFIGDAVLGTTLFAVPFYADYLGGQVLSLGALGATGAFTYIVGCLTVSRFVDRVNTTILAVTGLATFVAPYLCIQFVNSIPPLYLIVAIGGLGMSMFWPSMQSSLGEFSGQGAFDKKVSLFNISWSSGLMIGPLIGGFLFKLGPRVPFLFTYAGCLAGMALVLYSSQHRPSAPDAGARTESPDNAVDASSADRFLKIAWLGNFTCWFVLGMTRYVYPKIVLALGLSATDHGVFMFVIGLFQTLSFLLLGLFSAWHFRFRLIVAAEMVAALVYVGFSLASSRYSILLLCALAGCCNGFLYFSSLYYSLFSFSRKGSRSAIHESMIGLGMFLGPLFAGIIAARFGLRVPFAVVPVPVLIVIAAQYVLHRRTPKTAPGQPSSLS
jgi:DHA1 family solute carrier family 18 vesicular amine transporter 1/2